MSSEEELRLRALYRFEILDTPIDDSFDDITRLASSICNTPVSLVSFVDRDRQWFKSRHGLELTETRRELAFCAHTIRQDRTMVVEDASQDQRFSDNELVTCENGIRFYAGAPLRTDDGYALGTLCVIDYRPRHLSSSQLDALEALSRQAMAQLKLLRANQRLELAVKGSTDGLWEWWRHPQEDWWWSARCFELLGLTESPEPPPSQEMVGRIHPEDLPLVQSAMAASGSLFEVNCRFLHGLGEFRWYHVRGVSLRNDSGRLIRMAGSLSDVHGEVSSRRALALNERRLDAILSHLADGILLLDEIGKLQSINPAAEEILGIRAQEFLGRSVARLTAEELPEWTGDLQGFLGHFQRSPSGGGRFALGKKSDGGSVPLDISVSRMALEGRTHYIVSLRDASGRLADEHALQRARVQAEQANRAKSEFLANMSHELRTPLNAIIGFSEVLRDQSFGPLNTRQARYVKSIVESGHHLLSLVNHILDLFKIESGKLELSLEEVSVEGVSRDSITLTSSLAMARDITVELRGGERFWVRADASRLRQVLVNLLSNSIKFTPAQGTIQLGWEQVDQGLLKVWVKDNGIGVKPEDQERVFLEFEQVDSGYARAQEGSGLGLALTRRLVQAHGGEVWLESSGLAGEGTTVYFTLPLVDAGEESTREDSVGGGQPPQP